jgi:hypothetical protein
MSTAAYNYNPENTLSDDGRYSIPERIQMTECSTGSGSTEPALSKAVGSAVDKSPTPQVPGVVLIPHLAPLKGKFILLQSWEGRIVNVGQTEFDAIITDKTNPEIDDEMVTIDRRAIAPDDDPLVEEGAVFYWSVGYCDYPGRGRSTESKIRFRRLKGWTKDEISQSKRVGRQLAEYFKSNSICPSPA